MSKTPAPSTALARLDGDDELAALADLGELAGPLAHEMNNFLNDLLLQMAAWEGRLPDELREDLVFLRRQSLDLAAVVKQWQDYRRRRHSHTQAVDLHAIVSHVVETWRRSSTPRQDAVSVCLRSTAPARVTGTVADVHRLVSFLTSNAIEATALTGGTVALEIAAEGHEILLRIEDTGPRIAEDALPSFFEPGLAVRDGTRSLELAACKSIVGRMGGRISVENRPAGGVLITVRLKA